MKKKEKEFLRRMISFHKGLLSPAEIFNWVGEHKSEKIIHELVAKNYIEEVPTNKNGTDYTFYRLSQKAINYFKPFYFKFWTLLKQDLRSIIVSVVTTIITVLITQFITK